jgi:hypothetical protein
VSGGRVCRCDERRKPLAERRWLVDTYKGNYSAFNGYRLARSDYSAVRCGACGACWRTRADYVDSLKSG